MNQQQKKIYASAVDMIGHTPLVRLDRLFPDSKANLYAKIEFNNPAGSVKDRPANATITGAVRYLRQQNLGIESIAVEPAESPVLSGGDPGPHGIQGIGAGFVPQVLDRSMVSRIETVTTEDAIQMARKVALTEGLLTGISSGAVLAALSRLAYDDNYSGKTVVGIIASGSERYLSTRLCEDLV